MRAPRAMLVGALVFAIVCAAFGLATPRLLGRASNDFVAQGSESLRAEALVERASGLSASPQLLVLVRDPTSRRLARVERIVESEPLFPKHAPPLYSRDRRAALVAAYARAGVSEARWRKAADRVAVRLSAVPGTAAGGAAIGTSQVNRQVQQDLTHAEELAFPVLFVLALIVFGSGVAALLPLVSGALTIVGALLLLRLLDAVTPISTYALNIVTGAGSVSRSTTASCSSPAIARSSRNAAPAPTLFGPRSRPPAGRSRSARSRSASRSRRWRSSRSGSCAPWDRGRARRPARRTRLADRPAAALLPARAAHQRTARAPAGSDPAGTRCLVPARARAHATPGSVRGARGDRPDPGRDPVHVDPLHRHRRIGPARGRQLARGRRRASPEFRSAGISPAYAVVHGSAHSLLRAVGPVWTLERSRKETHADRPQVRPRGGPRRARHRRERVRVGWGQRRRVAQLGGGRD